MVPTHFRLHYSSYHSEHVPERDKNEITDAFIPQCEKSLQASSCFMQRQMMQHLHLWERENITVAC